MATLATGIITAQEVYGPLEGRLHAYCERLQVAAERAPELVDITAVLNDITARSGIQMGQMTAFCSHTTASLVVNENESLLKADIEEFLERLASSTANYRHDNFDVRTENIVPDHGRNAHAHLKMMLFGVTLTLPIVDGRLALGEWQRVFLLELDRPKPRNVLVQVHGLA